jgi:ribosomal protein S18 acetylase RimI-like enzyme
MSRLEVRPLDAADLADAAHLLAQRHRRHRQAQPRLAARYEDAAVAEEALRAEYAKDGASGAAGFRAGRMVGFVLGTPKPSELWGPNIWVEAAGLAAEEAEAVRDIYAVAATRWVDEGRKAHYAIVPAHDAELVRAWFRLGFGQQHAHGIRDVLEAELPPAKVDIRRPERSDIPALARLDLALPHHQALSPVFSAGKVPTLEEAIAEWESDLDDPEYAVFVAERDGAVVGYSVGCALEKSSAHSTLARPDHAGFLGFAAVLPESRGFGAGRALGEAVLAWSGETGFDCVVTDWRVTNLLSSRTWPALGFEESFLRLHRLIGY